MLSYRHAFHAGNHADVLKHAVLVHLLGYLAQKDKPFWYVDTHAGAAVYALEEAYAQKNAEFDSGIVRLWAQQDLPAPLEAYVAQVRACNPRAVDPVRACNLPAVDRVGALRFYPGSPQIAMQMLRAQDRARLFELHSTESRLLGAHFRNEAPRVLVQAGDGFDGLKSVLPPPSRRGLVLIDPSYEDKRDYARVRTKLQDALQRFATGVYLIWYPLVQRRESQEFLAILKRLQRTDWLHVSLSVKAPPADGFGLYGSGLYVLNPPWTLPGMLGEVMPYLVRVLGQDARAGFELESELK